jgi:hypothetical protein
MVLLLGMDCGSGKFQAKAVKPYKSQLLDTMSGWRLRDKKMED